MKYTFSLPLFKTLLILKEDTPCLVKTLVNLSEVCMFIFVYLSLLRVAHLNNVRRKRLVVTRDSARIRDEITAEELRLVL